MDGVLLSKEAIGQVPTEFFQGFITLLKGISSMSSPKSLMQVNEACERFFQSASQLAGLGTPGPVGHVIGQVAPSAAAP